MEPLKSGATVKQLARRQLQADLDAAGKREDLLVRENERYRQRVTELEAANKFLDGERDDWRFAFRAICRVVNQS